MNKYLLLFFYFLAVAILFYPVIFQNNTFGSGDTLNPYAINHILDIYKDKIGKVAFMAALDFFWNANG
ncbi:MAG: hypothetical protein Ct9H300mP24_2830 [Candidatus Neomarinimicrobiota bacterium]|nr:MAG: hypothetical protein Ct9H300mP24_2830 [Candidatus Neomarinimicrobiota bacterium]